MDRHDFAANAYAVLAVAAIVAVPALLWWMGLPIVAFLLSLPLLALGIFLAVFTSVLVQVMRRSARQFDAHSRLPLEGDEEARRDDC